jgi:DNA-binding MurR/RpiR family transcriptional regulator
LSTSLVQKLQSEFPGLTRSEKAVANYMLNHLRSLPYETASSIAESAGVSAMTVSRFLRSLGFNGLSELKEQLRVELDAAPLLVSDRLQRMRKGEARDGKLWENFDLEVMATLGVYELTSSPTFAQVVEVLADAGGVFVCGFQTLSGMASDFAARLDYARPGARFVDGANGTFGEVLASEANSPCLILFEMRRYSKASIQLAEMAREAGMSLIILCDDHCYWARDYTDLVLSVSTRSNLFWDNQAPFASLSNLLIDAIIARLGDKVAPRLEKLRALQDRLGAFAD